MAPFVREKIDKFENDQLKRIRQIDNEALDLYARHSLRKGGNAVVVEGCDAAETLIRLLRTEPAE